MRKAVNERTREKGGLSFEAVNELARAF